MESELSPDKNTPPVPLKTYQWEDVRRAREAGCYPWTHLLKPPLEGEITAEDILRETTPRRSMSREFSRSRTRSPSERGSQKILNLDASPGSSRKHSEYGDDEGVHIPNFSKEISLDTDEDAIKQAVNEYISQGHDEPQNLSHLSTPIEIPRNVSPKGILKRRVPEQQYSLGMSESREKTKCCHPLVNKIKHLADKTLQKLEKIDNEKSPQPKRKKNENTQEIRQLKASPSAIRRQKFSAVKLGDSDEMSKSMSIEKPSPPRKKKEHIYEDIEESKTDKTLQFSSEKNDDTTTEEINIITNQHQPETKSLISQDPSLVNDDSELRSDEHIMEILHHSENTNKEAVILDDDADAEEPNVDEIFQNQLEESMGDDHSPSITITEITEESSSDKQAIVESLDQIEQKTISELQENRSKSICKLRRWTSEGGTPIEKPLRPSREGSVQIYTPDVRCACQFFQSDSLLPERHNPVGTRQPSRTNNYTRNSNFSDHEYEIIEKPHHEYIGTLPQGGAEQYLFNKSNENISGTDSSDNKHLTHKKKIDSIDYEIDENLSLAKSLQQDIEDRFFANTPSSMSRTECEISTSQVDSSALENLPLKRESRNNKNTENIETKISQRLREGTGKLKNQAGKLKSKLQTMKTKQFSMPERPKINFPDRPKIKLPDRPKFNFPERPKFTMPDRRKFSLPERPKFKKINIAEKLSWGDRKKFTLPERPKFNMPDMPKIKFPDTSKINFSSLTRKSDNKTKNENMKIDYETKTYPRLFSRKQKPKPITTSTPSLNREDSPPPVFTFTKVKKTIKTTVELPDSPEQPREYGRLEGTSNMHDEFAITQYDNEYDFDRVPEVYEEEKNVTSNLQNQNTTSVPDMSRTKKEYNYVINEINNDEFFVRPRGISRENIQMREYLSDEIRQAFNIPQNSLALMSGDSRENDIHMYTNDPDADPELLLDENEPIGYSNEDVNEKDDGYYTFPPVRPSRAKRKKKELESVRYIDESVTNSMQFSEVDIGLPDDHINSTEYFINENEQENLTQVHMEWNALQSRLSEVAQIEDFEVDKGQSKVVQMQTLPLPPKRKKKTDIKYIHHSSLSELNPANWTESCQQNDDIIVYRTEHQYIPDPETFATDPSPLAPTRSRNRSRSSHGTSLCDDDRTSQGAESLTLDTHLTQMEEVTSKTETRPESPGYATVDKGGYSINKISKSQQSLTKTPPARRRKSNSSERKYYTVGPVKTPNRPPRKKSSTSMMTLDTSTNLNASTDMTQYDEIVEPKYQQVHKELISGSVINKMKDRPLPPPPRPPRGSRKKHSDSKENDNIIANDKDRLENDNIVETEASTQTDPLPDDVDYEFGMDENLDISMSSSIRDIIDDDFHLSKSLSKIESPRVSRPTSRSEKSFKASDPKMSELSKSTLGRTSPTVILVERRVSSPTRINDRDTILTEASLTVEHIDVEELKIPSYPPLPTARPGSASSTALKSAGKLCEEKSLERITNTNRNVEVDNLVTQRLQVADLDVGKLTVSELQASKISVSDIEGMTLQVSELGSKSGQISVSGIEFSQNVIDEIVKKFAELSPHNTSAEHKAETKTKIQSREEETQTNGIEKDNPESPGSEEITTPPPLAPVNERDSASPPQRPPPPDLSPLFYSYIQDLSVPSSSLYNIRSLRDRPFSDFHETLHQSHSGPTRRHKRRPASTAVYTGSSSDEDHRRPSPRRVASSPKPQEPTVAEAGAQFVRVFHNSLNRTIRNMFNSLMSYISGTEDKKDVQMALVIFLVLVAGLIMFGISDSRTVHHHHWEFMNPPNTKQ